MRNQLGAIFLTKMIKTATTEKVAIWVNERHPFYYIEPVIDGDGHLPDEIQLLTPKQLKRLQNLQKTQETLQKELELLYGLNGVEIEVVE